MKEIIQMRKILKVLLVANFLIVKLSNSQTVIASAGGFVYGNAASLSFTIGETNTQTLVSSTNMLTQGFQQPFKATLHLKMYLEGYYTSGGKMENVLYNQGITAMSGTECDTIEIQLRQAIAPYQLVSTSKSVLLTDGTVTFGGTAQLGENYYIVIKHRNAIETWSATAIAINENTHYDFTTAANKAYGNNQTTVGSGVYALFSGDLNADENVDLLDISIVETAIDEFLSGYYATDINGDGNVDLLDATTVENNANAFVFAVKP